MVLNLAYKCRACGEITTRRTSPARDLNREVEGFCYLFPDSPTRISEFTSHVHTDGSIGVAELIGTRIVE